MTDKLENIKLICDELGKAFSQTSSKYDNQECVEALVHFTAFTLAAVYGLEKEKAHHFILDIFKAITIVVNGYNDN